MQNCLLEVLLLLTPSGLLTTLVYLYHNAGKPTKQACHIILINTKPDAVRIEDPAAAPSAKRDTQVKF